MLARTDEAALAITDEQVGLVKRTICKGATDDELTLFVQTANRLRLDPFARQVFAVKRWDSRERREVMQIQVSIDGLRLVAERTGQYRGQTEPEWCGGDGEWCKVWLQDYEPSAARCGVYREGFAEPVYAVARWRDYVQTKKDGTPNTMWSKFGPTMLHKCAESLALRKAFPMELSGVYTDSEMGQAERSEQAAEPEPARNAPVFAIPFGEHAGRCVTDPAVPRAYLHKVVGGIEGAEKRGESLSAQKRHVLDTFRAEIERRRAEEADAEECADAEAEPYDGDAVVGQ